MVGKTLTFLIAVWGLSACTTTPMSTVSALDRFVEMFPGRYDSYAQTRSDVETDRDDTLRNYRRHSIFRRVDLPEFGDIVFLAHQYRDGDPDKIYRQRLYTLWEEGAGFRLRVHVPKPGTNLAGAYHDPEGLEDRVPEDFIVWDGCDLFWVWEGDQFVGTLTPGACRFTSEAFGQDIVLEETLTLSETQMTFADRGLSLSGEWLFGMRGDTPNISRRVRPFLCDHEDEAVWLHDQGRQSDSLGLTLTLTRDNKLTLSATPKQGETMIAAEDPGATLIILETSKGAVTCRYAPATLYNEGR